MASIAETSRPESIDPGKVETGEDPTVFNSVLETLSKHEIPFKRMSHRPTLTSEESAAVRGVPLHSGAKAMLLVQPVPDRETPVYTLVVMAANKKVDWKLLRKKLGKKAKLVSREDVQKISGCIPGAVPPFGSLLKTKANTLVDPSLQKQGTSINFNAGLTTESIQMPFEAFQNLENPEHYEFCKPE